MLSFPIQRPLNRLTGVFQTLELTRLLECFFFATGIPCEIRDCDGTRLCRFGEHELCTIYHRAYPASKDLCRDLDISRFEKGRVCSSECEIGLVDYCLPFFFDGKTIGTAFVGQIFHETPIGKNNFAKASLVGLEPTACLQAAEKIPVVSKERAILALEGIVAMAEIIVHYGQMERFSRDSLNIAKHPLNPHLLDRLPFALAAFGEDQVDYVNGPFLDMSGYTLKDLQAKKSWTRKELDRVRGASQSERGNAGQYPKELTFVGKDGARRFVSYFIIRAGTMDLVAVIDRTPQNRTNPGTTAR